MINIYRLALLLTALVLLSSCAPVQAVTNNIAPIDGEVYAVRIGTTLWGMRQAVMEKAGTMIMEKDNLITFIWTVKDGWCFAVIDARSQSAVEDFATLAKNGNMVNPRTMTGLVDWMKSNGWEIVGAKDIPVYITTAISSSVGWLATVASNMTTFILMPPGIVPPEGAQEVWQ